jgi:hypothetical protein
MPGVGLFLDALWRVALFPDSPLLSFNFLSDLLVAARFLGGLSHGGRRDEVVGVFSAGTHSSLLPSGRALTQCDPDPIALW